MFRNAIINLIIGAVVSSLFTLLVVGLIIGEPGMPATFGGYLGNNVLSAALGGGITGFALSIVMWKKFNK